MVVLREGDPPNYGPTEKEAFTLRVHHGGYFTEFNREYVGGEIVYYDHVCVDYINLLELNEIARSLHVVFPYWIWYKPYGDDLYFLVEKDEDTLKLDKELSPDRVCDLYFSDPPTAFRPIQTIIPDELRKKQSKDKQVEVETIDDDEDTQPDISTPTEFVARDHWFGDINPGNEGPENPPPNEGAGAAENIEEQVPLQNMDEEVPVEDRFGNQENEEAEEDGIVDSDYEQDDNDIASHTCVDTTKSWEGMAIPEMMAQSSEESGADGDDSEELHSLDGSDGEDDSNRKWVRKRYPEFNPKTDMKNPTFKLGMTFDSVDTFRKAVRAHAIKHKRDVKFKVNDKDRVRAVCNGDGCEWIVFASMLAADKKTFKVKTLNDNHTCAMVFKNRFVNSTRLAERYVNQWSVNPDWNFSGMAQQVREDVSLDISEWQYYRARAAARTMIEGTIKAQYARLWDYCAEVRRSNPGSTVQMKCRTVQGDDNPHFQRLYICLGGLKAGWMAGCRPILGLDGCFIKGHHKGQLLAAVGVDGNNQMYPVAYAVVESETKETWRWFLEFLNEDLQLNNSGRVGWITDKQKWLLDVLRELFPDSEHRHCVKHLHNNFKVHHKGLFLKQQMWSAAKSTTEQSFHEEMEKIKLESPTAFEWLSEKNPTHWCTAFLREETKCDMICNNMCEAFNSAIMQARDKPIITLLEMIRNYMMKRLSRKRAEIEKWKHPVGSKVFKYVEKMKSQSVYCTPVFSGNHTFQVQAGLHNQYVVDLEMRTCACRKWQLVGIPCSHAMSVLLTSHMNPFDYVDAYYKKETYVKAYQPMIYGLNGPKLWPRSENLPVQCPEFKKQRGRPKKSRQLQSDEVRKGGTTKLRKNYYIGRCGLCGQVGHNKRRCSKRGQSSQATDSSQPAATTTQPRATSTEPAAPTPCGEAPASASTTDPPRRKKKVT